MSKTEKFKRSLAVLVWSIIFVSTMLFGCIRDIRHSGKTNTMLNRATRIVFSSDRTGNFEIYSMKPDGTDVKQITSGTAKSLHPDWSGDMSSD